MGALKNDSYLNIQAFMVKELKLSGNDLLVYAIIYGFSQDGESDYHGTRAYLAEWCGCTVRGIQKNLNGLVERGLIAKVKTEKGQQVRYVAVRNLDAKKADEYASQFTSEQSSTVNKVPSTSEQSSPVPVNKVPSTSEQSSHRYYRDTIEDKLEDKLEEEDKQNITVVSSARVPTKTEVFDFLTENCPHINPEGFFKYYDKTKWTQNGEPIKDWRRLAVTWEENMIAEVEEADRLPLADEMKLWKEYEKKFGKKVDPYYYGRRQKYVLLAIATDTPLPERSAQQ